jgi:hypothetical protein
MKRFLIGAALSLMACATTSSSTKPTAANDSGQVDAAKMSAVESAARWRGVSVYWVNPPRKP